MSTATQTKTITTRDFLRQFKRIKESVRRGSIYTVTDRGEVAFEVRPSTKAKRKPKYTLDDILKLTFNSGEKNLSSRVDEIVYGVKTR